MEILKTVELERMPMELLAGKGKICISLPVVLTIVTPGHRELMLVCYNNTTLKEDLINGFISISSTELVMTKPLMTRISSLQR